MLNTQKSNIYIGFYHLQRSHVLGLVKVFRVPCIIVIGVRVKRTEFGSLRMMASAVVKSWEVQWCWGTIAEAVVPVPGKPVSVPQSRNSPVAPK